MAKDSEIKSNSFAIDDGLYSRQRYMLGDQAMKKMMSASVLLIGCDCLGAEIAKNLALTGVGNLRIADNTVSSHKDTQTNFYVTDDDVKNLVTRAAACVPRIKELNPYVNVSFTSVDIMVKQAIDDGKLDTLKDCLKDFDCVICSQTSLEQQLLINKCCRELQHVKFISANVFGLFSSMFCDFGDQFDVHDLTGEQLKENFIADISVSKEGLVTCLDNAIHGLESGDLVVFKNVIGMSDLNQQIREVKVVSPHTFSIGDTTSFSKYEGGGMFKEVNRTSTASHCSLQSQLAHPSILSADFGKMENPLITHTAFIALHKFFNEKKRLPSSYKEEDFEDLYSRYINVVKEHKFDISDESIARNIVRILSLTSSGLLPPLCAAIGGIVSQEALKSITGKYSPLNQWLYTDAIELFDDTERHNLVAFNEISLGKDLFQFLSTLNIFIVGCGAIGCEMLKNFALLSVSSGDGGGKITLTDNDTIEKSNLNRQFLFRSKHVGMSKSKVGSIVAKEINPNLNIESMQHKVGPETQESIFTDSFFQSNDIIVNALDNVEARRYMDARCVSNQLPLVESGTMGPKGHVQVVVPFVTESYSSQSDPPDVQYPFCTLKSFPSRIEHTIQWARDKFEVIFSQMPMLYNKFWDQCFTASGQTMSSSSFEKYIDTGGSLSDACVVIKLLSDIPEHWEDCVHYARCKFERFFNHKAKNLITAFPLDTKLQDGTLFWSLPKRPPTPLSFDTNDSMHMQFIISLSSLIASVFNIMIPNSEDVMQTVLSALKSSKVPEFVPSKKEIVTDENAPPAKQLVDDDVSSEMLGVKFEKILASGRDIPKSMSPEHFEKDDDSNHHIDFITATANLRATMYGIDNADRLEIKRIAGRIIPAISTTTSAVAGFATIQFLQLAVQIMKNKRSEGSNWVQYSSVKAEQKLSLFRNAFINLALPIVIFSEPAASPRTALGSAFSYTEWDQWDVTGNKGYTLNDFMQHFQSKLQLQVSAVLQGSKMVYMSFMPGHSKKLTKPMLSLLKNNSTSRYADLTVTFVNDKGGDDLSCPRVRYFLGV